MAPAPRTRTPEFGFRTPASNSFSAVKLLNYLRPLARSKKVRVGLHQDSLIPALKQMADAMVTAVEINSVAGIEALHEVFEIALHRLQQQMEMIGHQHIAMQLDVVAIEIIGEDFKKFEAIPVIPENVFPFVPTTGYMMPTTRVVYTEWTSHAQI